MAEREEQYNNPYEVVIFGTRIHIIFVVLIVLLIILIVTELTGVTTFTSKISGKLSSNGFGSSSQTVKLDIPQTNPLSDNSIDGIISRNAMFM